MPFSFDQRNRSRLILFVGLIVYISFFALNTLTRTADFTDPDAMNFVDVARNIKNGQGISQSTLGFNMPRFDADDPIPIPMTAQPPLYPLLISLVSFTGISCTAAGLLLSVLCYFFVLLICYRLCHRLFDENTALFASACLLLYEPLRRIAATTFSETLGLMLLLSVLFVLLRIKDDSVRNTALAAFCTGLLAGLTFITRFALAPLAVVGGLFVLIESRRKVADCVMYIIGFMIPAGCILYRNYVLIGSLMPEPNPSNVGFITNVGKATKVLLRQSPDSLPSPFETIFISLAVIISLIFLIRQKRLVEAAKALVIKKGSYLIPLFVAGYMAFLIVQRTRVHFDHINWRLIVPAGVLLTVWAAAFVVFGTRLSKRYATLLAAIILTFSIGREAYVTCLTPPVSGADWIAQSERLQWAETHTDSKDLIIGMNTLDIVHYLDRPGAVSFSPFPYCDYWTYEKLVALAEAKSEYRRIFLLLPIRESEDYERLYGPFFNQLSQGTKEYTGLTLLQRLDNESIYELNLSVD